MSTGRLRRRVAFEAAKLIFTREETCYGRAKMKAVRQLVVGQPDPNDLPCNREIRGFVQSIVRSSRAEQEQIVRQVAGQSANLPQSEQAGNQPHFAVVDRFRTYELLLLSLENVMQSPEAHPEGDALYHSLQVFALARQRLPYDEEFLLAALLHDVGKAIDRRDYVAAGLEAIGDAVSPRTAWLIEHHVEALSLGDGTLGVRLRRRLEAAEHFDELMLLADCDRQGRAVGVKTPDVWDALRYVRNLAAMCGDAEL
jgi:hypothetical protein